MGGGTSSASSSHPSMPAEDASTCGAASTAHHIPPEPAELLHNPVLPQGVRACVVVVVVVVMWHMLCSVFMTSIRASGIRDTIAVAIAATTISCEDAECIRGLYRCLAHFSSYKPGV